MAGKDQKVAVVAHKTLKHTQSKDSTYFDMVRSLSNDPVLQKAVDKTEQQVDGKGGSPK